ARERAKHARESRGMSRRDARRDSPVNDTVSHGPPDPTRPNEENKSSSNSRRGAGTPDDDEGTSQLNPTIGAAVAVLARHDLDQRQTARSEERRVGKEGRAPGSPEPDNVHDGWLARDRRAPRGQVDQTED